MTLTCIIIDDEPRAIEIIQEYVEEISSLVLLKTFRSPIKAVDFLKSNDVDLVFLDINMPNLTGIQFIKSLTHKPYIILTTAYSEYAVESYQSLFLRAYFPLEYLVAVLNNGGGFYNHKLFWSVMAPNAGLPPTVSERQIPLHEHYFRLYAGNNTVVVNGSSHGRDEGSWKGRAHVWQNTVVNIAAEPQHLEEGIAPEFSFATQYLDDTVNNAEQQRTRSLDSHGTHRALSCRSTALSESIESNEVC